MNYLSDSEPKSQAIEILKDGTIEKIKIDNSIYFLNKNNLIGRGTFGTVYKIDNEDESRSLAMKIICKKKGKYQDSEKIILLQINHKNIVKFRGFAETKIYLFLFFEYCEGGSLRQYLNIVGKVSEYEAFFIIEQIVEGMIHCLEKKIIHRDLKPENVLFDQNEKLIKICDFGLAKLIIEEDGEKVKDFTNEIGTLPYIAPEVISDKIYNSKCDVWSIGIIFYELLFGKLPWEPVKTMIQLGQFFENGDMNLIFPKEGRGISKITKEILKKMLMKKPEERGEFKEVLREVRILLSNQKEFDKKIQEMSEIKIKENFSENKVKYSDVKWEEFMFNVIVHRGSFVSWINEVKIQKKENFSDMIKQEMKKIIIKENFSDMIMREKISEIKHEEIFPDMIKEYMVNVMVHNFSSIIKTEKK